VNGWAARRPKSAADGPLEGDPKGLGEPAPLDPIGLGLVDAPVALDDHDLAALPRSAQAAVPLNRDDRPCRLGLERG
jgi:hypothetical protein